MRSQFKFDDDHTNVGHIVASEYNNRYPEGTEIKLLVHPLLPGGTSSHLTNRNSASDSGIEMSAADTMNEHNGINNQKGQIEGYGPPVVFTCDSKYRAFCFVNRYTAQISFIYLYLYRFSQFVQQSSS